MNTKFDLTEMSANIVYLKPMDTADLPDEVREQAGDMGQVFAVHNGQGEQVAVSYTHLTLPTICSV